MHDKVKMPALMADGTNTLNGPTLSAIIPGIIRPGNERPLIIATR